MKKVNQRCRVCGRFLTEARERRGSKEFIQVQRVCRRFAPQSLGNDIVPPSFVYANK